MSAQNSKIRVLVADDDEDICLYLKRYLERRQCQVTVVFDGADAKRLMEENVYDYFLLDCSMPSLTGLELIETARRRNVNAKIVIISGFPSADNEFVQHLGGDMFIHKPIQLAEIDEIFK